MLAITVSVVAIIVDTHQEEGVSTTKTNGKSSRVLRRATRDEQATEILAHLRRRERRVYEALLMILSIRDEKVLRSFAILLDFVVGLAERRAR